MVINKFLLLLSVLYTKDSTGRKMEELKYLTAIAKKKNDIIY